MWTKENKKQQAIRDTLKKVSMHVKMQRQTFTLNESSGAVQTIPQMEPELFSIIESELQNHDSLRDGMLTSQEVEFESAD